jgi:multidrug resistance efflux pump
VSEQRSEEAVAEADVEDAGAESGSSKEKPGGRRPLKRRTRIGLIVVGALAVVTAAVLVGSWMVNNGRFVSTDNAQIDGTQISIIAPATGTLSNWTGTMGTTLTTQQAVGRIAIPSGYMQPEMVVRSPAIGVVAVNNGVNGSYVTAGTQLAIAYDPATVFVTARVNETDIDEVAVGKLVDISVDAFPGTQLAGHVVEIKNGAAGVFSLFGQSNTTGNFQKVTQVIPVKISIDDRHGLPLVPGMNVTAKIHK